MKNVILEKGRKGDIIFMSTLKLNRFADVWEVFINKKNSYFMDIKLREQQESKKQFLNVFSDIIKNGIKVVLEAPKPIFYTPVYRCVDWFNKLNPICKQGFDIDKDYLLKYREKVLSNMMSLGETNGYYIWDNFNDFCPDFKVCNPFSTDSNRPIFSDGDHLSPYGNYFIYNTLIKELVSINFLKN